jgi:hypothetical protein
MRTNSKNRDSNLGEDILATSTLARSRNKRNKKWEMLITVIRCCSTHRGLDNDFPFKMESPSIGKIRNGG